MIFIFLIPLLPNSRDLIILIKTPSKKRIPVSISRINLNKVLYYSTNTTINFTKRKNVPE